MKVYEDADEKQADGHKILGTTVVLRQKDDGSVKFRICVQDFANTKRDGLFSPTPTTISLRLL